MNWEYVYNIPIVAVICATIIAVTALIVKAVTMIITKGKLKDNDIVELKNRVSALETKLAQLAEKPKADN